MNRATARLHHRGPDGRDTWVAPHGRAALGHTRLSIIDLETGAQPIASEDEQLRIVVNGEFYDYEKIRRTLERDGHRFRTRSDSEIALHLYEDLGKDCVHRLRGEFAFTIWDERRQQLFACRDRFGVKPLYYGFHNGDLYLASEMKALFAAGLPARWDPESVYFGVGLRGADRTPFQGIRSVPPGHYLTADRDGIRVVQYWDVDYPTGAEAAPAMSEQEYIEAFRSKLQESVRLRLRADVPVACYLSGGLDSCVILGLAAQLRSDPVRAFTLRFDHLDYDEGPIAQEMAARAGAEYVPIGLRQDDLADSFSDAVFHAEGVCINAHGVAKYLLSRVVRNAGYKVVLTGEGADEVLAGYPHFRQDMLTCSPEERDSAETDRLLATLAQSNEASRGILLTEENGGDSALLRQHLGFIPAFLRPQLVRFGYMQKFHNADYFAAFEARDPAELLLEGVDSDRRLKGRTPVQQSLYLWAKTFLPNYVLATLGDRAEMAHAIEGRVPFLDHEVAEFLQRTPDSLKIRGTTEKYILREAVRDVVTDTVSRRQKHPFLCPPAIPQRCPRMAALLQDTLRSKVVESIPFLDAARVRQMADLLIDMPTPKRWSLDSHLMTLASTIFLHQRMGVEG